jgi:hypothetical protein
MPPSLPHLPSAFLSPAVACSPREATPPDCYCHLHPRHCVRPIAGGRTAARLLPSSFSAATAQPRSRCAVLRPPDYHVLLKSICFECFRCFRGMLQVFQMDVVKVDRDVAYVEMVVHVCCKGLLPMFHLCFLDACCKYVYLDVLYMFQTYAACVLSGCCVWLQWFSSVFRCFFQVFEKHVSSVSSAFVRMLQLLYLDVSKVDRVLHLSSSSSATSSRCVLSALVKYPYDATAMSFRIGGATPFPSCCSGGTGSAWSA